MTFWRLFHFEKQHIHLTASRFERVVPAEHEHERRRNAKFPRMSELLQRQVFCSTAAFSIVSPGRDFRCCPQLEEELLYTVYKKTLHHRD